MEEPQIVMNFYPLFEDKQTMDNVLKQSQELFEKHIYLPPTVAIFSGENKGKKIKGFSDPILDAHNHLSLCLQSKNEEYEIFIVYYKEEDGYEPTMGYFFHTPFLQEHLSDKQIIAFFKAQAQLFSKLNNAYVLDAKLSNGIVYGLYDPFDFTGRNSDFTGFSWLNYLGPEEMALNGGEDLYHLPYITKAEPLGEGIFIQVGDSPKDATTEAGKQQLFKATEAWWQMMQAKQD